MHNFKLIANIKNKNENFPGSEMKKEVKPEKIGGQWIHTEGCHP